MRHRSIMAASLAALLLFASCSDEVEHTIAPSASSLVGETFTIIRGDNQFGDENAPLPFPITFVVKDAGNNPIPRARVLVTVTQGGGFVDKPNFRVNADGAGKLIWTTGGAGPQTLDIALDGGGASTTVNAMVIPATAVVSIQSGNVQNGTAGDTLPSAVEVTVQTEGGAPIAGATVKWAVDQDGAVVAGTSTTNSLGIASNEWILGWSQANQTLKAWVEGLDTVQFSANASTTELTYRRPVGDGQSGMPGDTLPLSLGILLLNRITPIQGAPITFSVVEGSATVVRPNTRTLANGRAYTKLVPTATGTIRVRAYLGGLDSLEFVATASCMSLAVGQAVMVSATSAFCVSGDVAETEYTLIPSNISTSSSANFSLTGTGIQAVTGPPTPRVTSPLDNRMSIAFGGGANSRDWEMELREADRALARRIGVSGRIEGARRDPNGPDMLIVPGVPAIGDLWPLNVASGCSGSRDDRIGRVVSIGSNVIIVADTTNPPGGFTTAQYDSIALEFDTLAYVTDSLAFGSPTDLDTNGRAVAFYTRAVNELSPPASSVMVLGFFTARDLFSSAPTSCPRSNEGEMFYMLVPDPTGVVNSNVRTVSQVRGLTVGTMAHELQHLISASRRIYITTGDLEEVWLNEALSHIAEELVFYRASVGLTPGGGNINLSALTTGPNASRRVAAFNTYVNPNFGRMTAWLQRADTSGPYRNTDHLAVRGSGWGALRYALDRADPDPADQNAITRALTDGPSTGLANLNSVFGIADYRDWVHDWETAMYSDDAVAGNSAQFSNPSWNFRSVYGGLGGYPLGRRLLVDATPLGVTLSRGGASSYYRAGIPAAGTAFFTPSASTGDVKLRIMRTK